MSSMKQAVPTQQDEYGLAFESLALLLTLRLPA
jgi:hypothetical protein